MWFEINLVERGVITADDFIFGLKHQLGKRPPFGRMAIEAGYLTIAQLFEVLKRQADAHEPIGEAAIALGFITPSQLAELLMKQSSTGGTLAESLIEVGILDEATVNRERRRFLSETVVVSGVYVSARDPNPTVG